MTYDAVGVVTTFAIMIIALFLGRYFRLHLRGAARAGHRWRVVVGALLLITSVVAGGWLVNLE